MMLFGGWGDGPGVRRGLVGALPLLAFVVSLPLGGCSKAVAPSGGPSPSASHPLGSSSVRFIIGGDSRDDLAHVLPWAFEQANARGATAFFFLGDMELTPQLDDHFRKELQLLGSIPLYPVLGNHEVKLFGEIPIAHDHAEREFKKRFLDKSNPPIHSSIDGKVVYSVTLAGGVHFIALDNVSQKGFGAAQLAWLDQDLTDARRSPDMHFIIVGMHKPLAKNGVTTHSMDDDGPQAIADSDAARAMMLKNKVSLIVASHLHGFVTFDTGGIPTYITGGLGAPLTPASGVIESFHHFLQVDVVGDKLKVDVVRFEGKPSLETEPEKE